MNRSPPLWCDYSLPAIIPRRIQKKRPTQLCRFITAFHKLCFSLRIVIIFSFSLFFSIILPPCANTSRVIIVMQAIVLSSCNTRVPKITQQYIELVTDIMFLFITKIAMLYNRSCWLKKKKKIKLSTTSATNINVLTQYNFFLNIINNNDIKISYILNSKLFHPVNFHNFQRSRQIKKDLPWNLRIFRPNVFFNTLRFTVNNLILSFDIARFDCK